MSAVTKAAIALPSPDAGVTDRAVVHRFVAIEGLRGWLAWTVVVAHIFIFAGLETWHPVGSFIALTGAWAVRVFVIVSGFVISHLLTERAEPYGAYILRRLMRLLPGFVLATALGALTVTWAGDAAIHTAIPGDAFMAEVIARRHWWFANAAANVFLHVTMLHGLFVPEHQYAYAFLPPGWSVSLEWQYYLVAPLLLTAVLRRPAWTLAAAMLLAAVWGAIGPGYASPSALPSLGFYFVIGALTRAWFRPANLPSTLAVLSISLPFVLRQLDLIPLAVWGAFVVFLTSERAAPIVRLALESRLARYIGDRSYSIYLLHFPVLWALFALAGPRVHSRLALLAVLLVAAPPLVVIAADLSYRFVERPGMALGRRLAQRLARRPVGAPQQIIA